MDGAPISDDDDARGDTRVSLLILGAGWTSTFLVPQLRSRGLSYALTTRDGHEGTLRFTFDAERPDADVSQYARLPAADAVMVTFPITVAGATQQLVRLYGDAHPGPAAHWVQLGSSGMWPEGDGTVDRHAPWQRGNARAEEEERLLHSGVGAVLDLAGLWGAARDPRAWIPRVAGSKAALAAKGSLHLVHGEDVARAVLAVVARWDLAVGNRWLLTDLRSYDWWDLALAWGSDECKQWAMELMAERGQHVLARDMRRRGKVLDSSEFWMVFALQPKMSLFTQ